MKRDKNALYEAIGNLLLQRIRPAEARTPADEMPVGFGGLTDEIAPEPTGHGLPLSKCEAYNRVYDQHSRSS